jgi:hypothetical protein
MRLRTVSLDNRTDDIGMILFALGNDGREDCRAERSAEIAQHVEYSRRGCRLVARNANHRDARQRRQHQSLPDRADDIGPEELVTGEIRRQVDVHQTAAGEDA